MSNASSTVLLHEDAERFRSYERQRHDSLASTYHNFFSPVTTLAIKPLLQAARIRAGGQLLDVATGPGSLASEAARIEVRVIGVDLSPGSRFNSEVYLYSPFGRPYTPDSLRARWNRWLNTTAGKTLCCKWKEWLKVQIARYEWEINPDDTTGPTIHGLRGTGILLCLSEGYDTDQISNDVGMSRQMVEHYMRFKDQMAVAVGGQKRLRLVNKGPNL